MTRVVDQFDYGSSNCDVVLDRANTWYSFGGCFILEEFSTFIVNWKDFGMELSETPPKNN